MYTKNDLIDAFIEYMENGLLAFPTHTWSEENNENNLFNSRTEPSCVAILTNLVMQREEAYRSHHPTHSVAAISKGAQEIVKGKIGDTDSYLCQAKPMADLTSKFLQKDQNLFLNDDPIPEEWYK